MFRPAKSVNWSFVQSQKQLIFFRPKEVHYWAWTGKSELSVAWMNRGWLHLNTVQVMTERRRGQSEGFNQSDHTASDGGWDSQLCFFFVNWPKTRFSLFPIVAFKSVYENDLKAPTQSRIHIILRGEQQFHELPTQYGHGDAGEEECIAGKLMEREREREWHCLRLGVTGKSQRRKRQSDTARGEVAAESRSDGQRQTAREPVWWTERKRHSDRGRVRGTGLFWINDCSHQKMNVLPGSPLGTRLAKIKKKGESVRRIMNTQINK